MLGDPSLHRCRGCGVLRARGGFEQFGKTTKRAAFLAEMDQVLPWGESCALIEPHYPKAVLLAGRSTKNAIGERDPEMKQSKKGNQWYFGMKADAAVDAKTKLIHHVVATSGAVHDGKVLPQLLHGKETAVWGDTAYAGQTEVIERHAPGPST